MAKEKGITVIMSLHEIDLAQKVSDKVMCVHGDHISNFGTPEEIFRTEIISAPTTRFTAAWSCRRRRGRRRPS